MKNAEKTIFRIYLSIVFIVYRSKDFFLFSNILSDANIPSDLLKLDLQNADIFFLRYGIKYYIMLPMLIKESNH